LADFSPTVTGAIANGTAGEHSNIHLQCFADSAKELGIFLMNQQINAQATTLPHFRFSQEQVQALIIDWQGELATIAVYSHLDQRGAMKPNAKGRIQRLDAKALQLILGQSKQEDHSNPQSPP